MKRKKAAKRAQIVALLAIACGFLLPLMWMLFGSIDPAAGQRIRLPESPTLQNYIDVLTEAANLLGFLNSLILSAVSSVTVVIFSLLAAYPLSRYPLRGKEKFMYVILFMTALPVNAVLVPVFRMFLSFGLQDNRLSVALFMAAVNLPYGIWMMKNFMDSVPVSLEEAALVDGCGPVRAMRHIIMPLMLPGVFTVLIFVFAGSWGNFFIPFILLQSPDKLPASVRIYQYFQQVGMIEYGRLTAYAVLYMMPCVGLYALSQRFMSKGFALSGADKG